MLALDSPNGGETYTALQPVWILWAANNAGTEVKLEWFDGSVWQLLTASTSNDGAELWTTPIGNFTGCKVRVSSTFNSSVSDESDAPFTITLTTPSTSHPKLASDGSVNLQIEQYHGRPNILQRSYTLAPGDWQDILTLSGESQYALIKDPAAIGQPRAFYRVRIP